MSTETDLADLKRMLVEMEHSFHDLKIADGKLVGFIQRILAGMSESLRHPLTDHVSVVVTKLDGSSTQTSFHVDEVAAVLDALRRAHGIQP